MLTLPGRLMITLAFAAVLVAASVVPAPRDEHGPFLSRLVGTVPPPIQKSLHVACYGLLAFLGAWTLQSVGLDTAGFVTVFLSAAGFGAAMEWLQIRIPTRFGSIYDVLLNAFGAGSGLIVALIYFS